MDCQEASRKIYAYVDGELDASRAQAMQAHVDHCPGCRRMAGDQEKLKSSVARVEGGVVAPAGLEKTIRLAIGDRSPRRSWFSGSLRWPMVAAAVFAFMIGGLWLLSSRDNSPRVVHVDITDRSATALALADTIYEMHLKCLAQGQKGYSRPLPRDGIAAARELGKELGLPVLDCQQIQALFPKLQSGGRCQLIDTQGQPHPGAHLVFENEQGQAVSLLSVSHLDELKTLTKREISDRQYAILAPSHAGGKSPTVLLWDCPGATHIVCAPMPPDESVELVRAMSYVYALGLDHPFNLQQSMR